MTAIRDVVIRAESPSDVSAIFAVNVAAFETDAEARLVDALRAGGGLTLSLVAVRDGAVVGHIAFSPVTVTSREATHTGLGLAPMAVAPAHQRAGVGGELIAEGLRRASALGHRFCVVLGHPDYYPKHGFVSAASHGVHWEHGHDEAFFVRALTPGGLDGVTGVVRYRPELDAV